MPKKKSAGKKKSAKGGKDKGAASAGAAPDPAEGMTKEELMAVRLKLTEELAREREERNYFQLERDKVNTFWEITKRQLEEARAEGRNKDREMEEVDEKHAVEIKVYKQKVKHLLYEQQNQITELRTDAAVAAKVALEDHHEEEAALRKDKRSLKIELKEMELAHEDVVKNLQLEHDKSATKMRQDLQRMAAELQRKYEVKMDALREDLDLRRKTELHEIEERKNGQIHALMKQHEKAFGDIKNYYNDITLNNLALINSMQEQLQELKKKDERAEKVMAEIMAENKRLAEPLAQARAELVDAKKQLVHHDRDRRALAAAKTQIKALTLEADRARWEYEVLEQRFTQLEAERDELYDRFVKTIFEVQQKSGFKNLLLERKLGSVSDQLEKKEAQLNEVLSASNLDPTALAVVSKKLEDVLGQKNAAIKDLQYDLAKVSKMHNDALRTYEAKLREHGISVVDLGFRPLELAKTTLGKAPAGLVAAH